MVNRGHRNAKRPRRSKINKRAKRKTQGLPTSAIRNTASVSVRAPAIRELCIYAKQFTSTILHPSATNDIWLDSLKLFGLIALKIFLYSITSTTKLLTSANGNFVATQTYVTSAVQSIFIGAEDVLWSSPLVERETREAKGVKYEVPCIDYQQAKMTSAVIRITSGSAIAARAGRFVACVMNISEEEISRYLPADETRPVNQPDIWQFQDVIQMPGAVTAPFGTPLTLKWSAHPDSYSNRFLGLGQNRIDDVDFTTNLRGGKPNFRLIIGYQDFASSTGAVDTLYSPDEAMTHIDIRGHIQLQENGRRYIRSWPVSTMNSNVSGMTNDRGQYTEIPLHEIAKDENGLLVHLNRVDDIGAFAME